MMKGLEIAKKYYESYVNSLFTNECADLKNDVAIGLIGEGSECFGYDDDKSKDHDFGLGFTIFIDDNIDEQKEFRLMRAYNNLPKEFMGSKRDLIAPAGGNRKGVIRLRDFVNKTIGTYDNHISIKQYLLIPQYAFANLINGEIWHDGPQILTKIREDANHMPLDCRLKRIAGNLMLMSQSGQYNFMRAIEREEYGAASLSLNNFIDATFEVIFLLSEKFMPFYKWKFRMLRDLDNKFSTLSEYLYLLMTTGNTESALKEKEKAIEHIINVIIDDLKEKNITRASCNDLSNHALTMNDLIKDANIRNENILYCV